MADMEIIPDLRKADNPDNRKFANLVDGKLWDDLKRGLSAGAGAKEFEAALSKLINK